MARTLKHAVSKAEVTASRVELFEGHARSGDVRAAKAAGDELPWNRA
ncbi:hypothetical protein [Streptomyces sp. GESEQ-35]|nr:hypothetical protein [Streptomyces sp. GESEQ-35]